MDFVNDSKRCVSNLLTSITSTPLMYGLIAMILAMYGPRLHPKLPDSVRQLFNNNVFRFGVILLIIYISNKDIQMALIIAIAFMIVMSLTSSQDILVSIQNYLTSKSSENFNDMNSISEFYEEEFSNCKSGNTQEIPEGVSEKEEGFNSINKFSSLENFYSNLENKPKAKNEFWSNIERFEVPVDEFNDDLEVDQETDQNVEQEEDTMIDQEVDDEMGPEVDTEEDEDLDEDTNPIDNAKENLSKFTNIVKKNLENYKPNPPFLKETTLTEGFDTNEFTSETFKDFMNTIRPNSKLTNYEKQLNDTIKQYTFSK